MTCYPLPAADADLGARPTATGLRCTLLLLWSMTKSPRLRQVCELQRSGMRYFSLLAIVDTSTISWRAVDNLSGGCHEDTEISVFT